MISRILFLALVQAAIATPCRQSLPRTASGNRLPAKYRLRRSAQEPAVGYRTPEIYVWRSATDTWRKNCFISVASTRPPRFKRSRDEEPSATENPMLPTYAKDSLSIGLDDESWKMLSAPQVNFLLNIFSAGEHEGECIPTSVSIFPPADGRDLYVKPH